MLNLTSCQLSMFVPLRIYVSYYQAVGRAQRCPFNKLFCLWAFPYARENAGEKCCLFMLKDTSQSLHFSSDLFRVMNVWPWFFFVCVLTWEAPGEKSVNFTQFARTLPVLTSCVRAIAWLDILNATFLHTDRLLVHAVGTFAIRLKQPPGICKNVTHKNYSLLFSMIKLLFHHCSFNMNSLME